MRYAEERIWMARIAVFCIAVIYAGISIIAELREPSDNMTRNIGIGIAIAGIFVAFGIMAKQSPFAGLLGSIILYGLLLLLELATGDFNILKGIVLRAIIITILLRGLLVAKEYELAKKEQDKNPE